MATARNAAMTRPNVHHRGWPFDRRKPIPYFQKEFFHNGYIKSLSSSSISTTRATR